MKRRAYTLIELLVVITIVAILMALLFTGIDAILAAAAETRCQNNLSQLAKLVAQYSQMYDWRLPPACTEEGLGTGNDEYERGWVCNDDGYIDEGTFTQLKLVGDPEIFFCPFHIDEQVLSRHTVTQSGQEHYYFRSELSGIPQQVDSKLQSSYGMNALAEDEDDHTSRRFEQFAPTAFLFIEQDPDTFNGDAAFHPDNNDEDLTTRHRGGGFCACVGGHVTWLSQEAFDDTRATGTELREHRWDPE